MSKLDDASSRTSRIRKKSAKVLEMEEFEEIEKKQFTTKKNEPKGKGVSTPHAAPPKKGKGKALPESPELLMPGVLAALQADAEATGFIIGGDPVIQDPPPPSPIKVSTKQVVGAKMKEGQGQKSVIKLLLSAPAIPTSPSVSTSVLTKTSPATSPIPPVISPPAAATTSKRSKVKAEPAVKVETVVKSEPTLSAALPLLSQDDLSIPVSVKGELLDPASAHLMLASTLQGPNDPMLSSQPAAAVKAQPPLMSSPDTLSSLKLKLMMLPKEPVPSLDSIIPTTNPISSLFLNPNEPDGTTGKSAGFSATGTGKKKAAPRKKKAPGEKAAKGSKAANKSAAEQMPNLDAVVSSVGGSGKSSKAGGGKDAQRRLSSMSDALEASLSSDASLDMGLVVDAGALDMDDETTLVIAEGATPVAPKPKKKRVSGGASGGSKKKKAKVDPDLAAFDPGLLPFK
jgi:hypothetical protein